MYNMRGVPTYFEKKFYTSNELDKFDELSSYYYQYPFFYCDLPQILPEDLEKFIQIFNANSANGLRTAPCFEEPWENKKHPLGLKSSWHDPLWKVLDIYLDPDLPSGFGHEIIASNYKNLELDFPKFYQQIFDLLPFKKIWFVKFLQNNKEILPHRDTDWNFNLPTSFRSMIYDENLRPTFYLKSLDDDEEKYVDLPTHVNTFAYNNGSYLHGAKYHKKTKILMVVRGYLDFAKYKHLLEKSIDKFKNYPL